MRYLVIRVFVTKDWEGAHTLTKVNWIKCDPDDLNKRLKRFKLTNPMQEVCSEMLVFDQNFELARRIYVDWISIRDEGEHVVDELKEYYFREEG